MQILDCTLRDGGYYTNWDFSPTLIQQYAASMEALPIEYIEVGYRNIPLDGYLGEYFYCPEYVLKNLKELMPNKKLVIILNEKDIRSEHIKNGLLNPCKLYVDLVRIAVDPSNMKRAINLAKSVKEEGFKVAFNTMYMSNWKNDSSFLNELEGNDHILDFFYLVDSFGGVTPNDVKETIKLVKSKTNVPLGFHGHNNLEMALINTITAMESGCDIVDCTITGMGRGAGNLKTELLLTYLESSQNLPVSFGNLSSVVDAFENLKKDYNWGTSLPYMFSGAKSLPQKQVMQWVGLNRYPLSCILNALNNQNENVEDNIKLPVLKKKKRFKKAVLLGGAVSAKNHKKAIEKFLEQEDDNACLIHAGTRNVETYLDIKSTQFYGMVGFESDKLLKQIGNFSLIKNICVYPPFPRPMGTSIPSELLPISKEIEKIEFTEQNSDSPLALAIQTAIDLGAKELYLVGFDGYDVNINQNQFLIAQENQQVLTDALKINDLQIVSVTPTKYKQILTKSIYSLIS